MTQHLKLKNTARNSSLSRSAGAWGTLQAQMEEPISTKRIRESFPPRFSSDFATLLEIDVSLDPASILSLI